MCTCRCQYMSTCMCLYTCMCHTVGTWEQTLANQLVTFLGQSLESTRLIMSHSWEMTAVTAYVARSWQRQDRWRGGGTEFGAYDKGRAEGTTRDDPEATQKCPKWLPGPHEKMPRNSRACQPDRCREGGARPGAKGEDRDARGRQGGRNRGGRERVPAHR